MGPILGGARGTALRPIRVIWRVGGGNTFCPMTVHGPEGRRPSASNPGGVHRAEVVPTRDLLRTLPTAVVVGIMCALTLLALSMLSDGLKDVVWDAVPRSFGILTGGDPPWWWTIVVLTLTGVAVGGTVRFAHGHAGPDPATTGLLAPPCAPAVLPGLAVALVLGLAGGVSLGPENPIIAVNVALAVWLFASRTRSPAGDLGGPAGLAVAGTIGALFATPVAAALVLTETVAERSSRPGPLFDRIFAPLVSAGAGSMTMVVVGAPTFSVHLGAVSGPDAWDLLSSIVVAACAALLATLGAVLLPVAHRVFHRLPVVVALTLGGLVLGLLGAAGGEVTLFKGLDEMKQLADDVGQWSWIGLLLLAVVKMVALTVATASGFRGGRIFPAVFVGVAFGLATSSLIPGVPAAVAVGAGILGTVLVVDRDGWVALFLAAVTVGDVQLLPLLCLTLAPLWLLARSLPEFIIESPRSATP